MAANKENIIAHYKGYNEDNRATSARFNGLEFHYTKKLLHEYISQETNVLELGCGTGHYGMHFADACAQYTGVDLSLDHIALFNEKIAREGKGHVRAVVGDATDIPWLADHSFDVVLCLGPMYHLSREERNQVFAECKRIAKEGAVLAFAYINAIGAYAGWCINEETRGTYPHEEANQNFLQKGTGHDSQGVFFLTSPEDMEQDARQIGLTVIKNCGLDFFFAQSAVDRMNDEQFALYRELSDRMCESPSCTGLADHALLLCKN